MNPKFGTRFNGPSPAAQSERVYDPEVDCGKCDWKHSGGPWELQEHVGGHKPQEETDWSGPDEDETHVCAFAPAVDVICAVGDENGEDEPAEASFLVSAVFADSALE